MSQRFGHPRPAFWASPFPNHPLLTLLQRFGHPPVPSGDAQIPSVLVIPSKKNSGFHGKLENVLEMDSAKYRNLVQYLKKKVYPKGFTRQDKKTLRKFAKKFEYDSKLESLFYVAKEEDGTALRRLVITEEEKVRVFEECHSAPFSGHAIVNPAQLTAPGSLRMKTRLLISKLGR